jgi:ElaA protein
MTFDFKPFKELTSLELYKILQLRSEVFVVEQNCVYQDIDNKDTVGYHLTCFENEELLAYARVLGPGVSYTDYSSIGRVCNKLTHRQLGLGKILMEEAIRKFNELFPKYSIKISAQSYLLKFYADLRFEKIGEEYLEDQIPHIAMINSL